MVTTPGAFLWAPNMGPHFGFQRPAELQIKENSEGEENLFQGASSGFRVSSVIPDIWPLLTLADRQRILTSRSGPLYCTKLSGFWVAAGGSRAQVV